MGATSGRGFPDWVGGCLGEEVKKNCIVKKYVALHVASRCTLHKKSKRAATNASASSPNKYSRQFIH